jgi:hypothetical protein
MTISLEKLRVKLYRRLVALDSGFDRHVVNPVTSRLTDKFALQEGYVSALWQAWCHFCRELIIHSAQGAITNNGIITTSPHSALSEMQIAYVAKQLSEGRSIANAKPLTGSHQEHTWGDVTKANKVASSIGCSNSGEILNGLSACLRVRDLQLCRNASAHISHSTIVGINAAKVRYQHNSFKHPSDMMFWVDPNTSDFLWKSWVDEINLAADFSVR